MSDVVEQAPAKLNLRLLVGPLRPDGYHGIESLMVSLEGLSDTVRVARSPERSVTCRGLDEALRPEENLAWRALDALDAEMGTSLPPLAVEIDKRIPARAGLGGGSSDAAATLRAADRLLGLGLGTSRLERVAAGVGSDVVFLVAGGCRWARGRGEVLHPASVPAFDAVIVVPDLGLSTPAVYRAFDRLPAPVPDTTPVPDGAAALPGWVRNDLWPAALACAPQVARTARDLRAAGATATLLCGSGAGVAGLFADRAAAERAAAGPLRAAGRCVARVSGGAP